MKYSITHCYTDHNKGDAAIIISTAQLIRESDPNALINMFSTFGPNDHQYLNEHEFIKPFSNGFFPGMFYQPRPIFGKSDSSRVFHFLWILFKFLVLLLTTNQNIIRLFFSNIEMKGITEFLDSDIIISKGGSYITTQNKSIRQSFSLISMLYPFFLANRYKKKIYIFSQSLGPVKGRFNQWLMRLALNKIEKIYLREDFCTKDYSEIKQLEHSHTFKIIPDTAFYLKNQMNLEQCHISIDSKELNIGITLVDHAFKYIDNHNQRKKKINTYKTSIIEAIKHLVETKNAHIHIFPQVISANSHIGHNDIRISKEIESIFIKMGFGDRVKYHYSDLNPMQLRNLYGKMDLFLGTRLHSVIFALSMNVPSINIAYHGTKSQGILASIEGFKDRVISIDNIYPEILIKQLNDLYNERTKLINILKEENISIKIKLKEAMETLISSYKNSL